MQDDLGVPNRPKPHMINERLKNYMVVWLSCNGYELPNSAFSDLSLWPSCVKVFEKLKTQWCHDDD